MTFEVECVNRNNTITSIVYVLEWYSSLTNKYSQNSYVCLKNNILPKVICCAEM